MVMATNTKAAMMAISGIANRRNALRMSDGGMFVAGGSGWDIDRVIFYLSLAEP